ncbi:hypothetical protein L9F63_000496, partial [Diploptera punctata]
VIERDFHLQHGEQTQSTNPVFTSLITVFLTQIASLYLVVSVPGYKEQEFPWI